MKSTKFVIRGPTRILALTLWFAVTASCATRSGSRTTPPPEYAALPDTVVCVVNRAAPAGLTNLPAKSRSGEILVFSEGQVLSLEALHPIDLVAGYAGREMWVQSGEQVTLGGERYSRTGGERRIDPDLLERVGEFRGILVFSGADDVTRPSAVYIPTAPGCVFQAYVREDLLRR